MNQDKASFQPVLDADKKDENEISIVEILFRYVKYWKWFVLSVVVALVMLFFYFRYTTPVYNVTANVILKHVNNQRGRVMGGTTGIGSLDGLEMMGSISSVVNEMFVIQSNQTVRTVIDRLDLHTSYITKDRIKKDLYTKSPFIIAMDDEGLDTLRHRIEFTAQLNEDKSITVNGTIGDKDYDTKLVNLPALLNTPQGIISFVLREGVEPYYDPLHIRIGVPASTVKTYRSSLSIKHADDISSVLTFSFKTPYPNKGKDFLNTLVEVYNYQTIEDRGQEAINTREFINQRLDIIDRELSSAEKTVEQYKREEGMTYLDSDLKQSMQQSSRYEQQLLQAETQLNIVNSLNEYLSNPENQNKSVPSNIGIQDPTLSATTNEYNKMLAERERLSKSMLESNPVMHKMDEQIKLLRNSINSSIASVRDGLLIERRNIANQVRIYSGRIGDVPRQERQFTEIAREQQIKSRLYILLLQKREENALALAATANSAKMLDMASIGGIVHPRKRIILLAVLLFALLLPVGVIYLLDLLQYKIRTRGDVDRLTKLPILGEIPSQQDIEKDKNIVVFENATTEVNEAFRIIRTKLMLSLDLKDKVIVFTSTIPGEGKTFTAINTAIGLAVLGKKVLLLGMDLRIPTLHTYLNVSNDTGLTTYLSGYEEDIENLILPTILNENLFLMTAGPIPPNPVELLSRDILNKAIEKLRPMFDYIVVDSSPVGPVTDTIIINRIADANVYVCRANYSSKMNLKYANELMLKGELKNMLLVINDVKDFHVGSGFGYGYGYGYGKQSEGSKRKKGK